MKVTITLSFYEQNYNNTLTMFTYHIKSHSKVCIDLRFATPFLNKILNYTLRHKLSIASIVS